MAKNNQTVEAICPKCKHTEIVYLPKEQLPKCEKCGTQMVINEILTEGKAY